jgi:DNA-binding Lrp family transcriptional regulator
MKKANLTPNELQNRIEKLREEMILLGLRNGFKCPRTITVSQKLDQYIAKYQAKQKEN